MGCGASKTVQVQPVAQTPREADQRKSAGKRSLNNKVGVLNEENNNRSKSTNKKKSNRSLSKSSLDSCDDDLDGHSDRGGSATSKTSKHSCDSGLGEDYSHVITELSDENKVKQIKNGFMAADDLDLTLSGVQCSRRLSAQDRERHEEKHILASLREEGLITRPKSRAAGGLSFDIMMAEPAGGVLRPPPRLAKLEKRQKKKKTLTEDEIRAKLEKAEQRRKQREQERIEKIEKVTKKSDITNALDAFAQQQQDKDKNITEKMSTVEENRERKLKELKEKLKAQEEHAEKVRRRKKLLRLAPHPESNTAEEIAELKG